MILSNYQNITANRGFKIIIKISQIEDFKQRSNITANLGFKKVIEISKQIDDLK